MKRHVIAVSACVVLASSLAAQDLTGTWFEQRYNATLVIHPNGTYAFRGPAGNSAGQAGMQQSGQGPMLWLRDAAGKTYWYRIHSLTGNALVLVDPNGAAMTYARQGAAPSAVIAAQDGLRLTQREVDTQVRLVQFVIGQNIKAHEAQALKQAAVQEFSQGPQKFLREAKQLGQTVALLEKTTNPLSAAQLRQALIAEFHKATQSTQEQDKPLIIRTINRYVRVLAYDPANHLALTDRDVAAAANLIDFRMRVQGQPALSAVARQQIGAHLVGSFLAVPVQTRRSLCSSQVVWLYMNYAWQRMGQQQRVQYGAAYARQARPAATAAYAPRPQGMSQSTYDAVRNSMLEGHAASMNALSSISGVPDYSYSVVDEDGSSY